MTSKKVILIPHRYLNEARHVYRILPIKRLLEIYITKKITLISPNEWEDPFEQYWLNLINPANAIKEKSVFGLCFSMQARSDALWRIYSPEMEGVRIKMNIGALKNHLENTKTNHSGKFVIGKVEYQKKDGDLIRWAEEIKAIKNTELTAKQTGLAWMRKRWGFNHEKETRLMYITHKKLADKKTVSFYINPHNLIKSIYVDPRLSKKAARELIDKIKSVVYVEGAPRIPIKHSGLYTLPKALRKL